MSLFGFIVPKMHPFPPLDVTHNIHASLRVSIFTILIENLILAQFLDKLNGGIFNPIY